MGAAYTLFAGIASFVVIFVGVLALGGPTWAAAGFAFVAITAVLWGGDDL